VATAIARRCSARPGTGAKAGGNRAAVVLAEAEIPRGIAEAFRSGNLGVMDYYKLKNVQAGHADARSRGGLGQTVPKLK